MTDLVGTVHAHARELAALRGEHEAEAQLSAFAVDAIRAARMLDGLVPKELGGLELPPLVYLEVIEALAAADPATGWCAMTAATSTLLAPYIDPELAATIWQDKAPFLAGVFAPSGKVTLEQNGVRLAGKWSYASGCRHAEWFVLGAIADGEHVVAVVPARDVTIVDNWDVLGLRGSGSHDVTVDVELPTHHLASVFGRPPWSDAPLYRVPLFGALACGVAACALGIAHHALEIALGREPAPAQLAIWARAWARVDASRAYLHATMIRATQHAVVSTLPADAATRGELRLAAVHVAHECADVVRELFRLGGGAAIRAGHPLNAALRDIETVLTHRMVAERVLPTAARALLGLGNRPADL